MKFIVCNQNLPMSLQRTINAYAWSDVIAVNVSSQLQQTLTSTCQSR